MYEDASGMATRTANIPPNLKQTRNTGLKKLTRIKIEITKIRKSGKNWDLMFLQYGSVRQKMKAL